MASIKASVNLFALLDGDDSGDKRLADFDAQHREQASALEKKNPAPPAKPKKKKPSPPASKAPPRKSPAPAAAAPKARPAMKSRLLLPPAPAPPPPARSTNLTGVLFAYPSARERIFRQRQERQEEFERREAMAAAAEKAGEDGKSAAEGARKGKTHGVRVQQGYYDSGAKQHPVAAVKEDPAPAPAVKEEPTVAPVVLPPSIDDTDQFPSLK